MYGLPLRVRSERGGETVSVSLFMLNHPQRGPGRGSMLVGRSVHYQLIERLWHDVSDGVTKLHYDLFMYMESIGILDPLSDVDLFCLHFVSLHGSIIHYAQLGTAVHCSFGQKACYFSNAMSMKKKLMR